MSLPGRMSGSGQSRPFYYNENSIESLVVAIETALNIQAGAGLNEVH